MRDDTLDEQHELIQLVESAGWEVRETDLSIYESPWQDKDDPEATITITAHKTFSDEENHSESTRQNQYRKN